MATCPTNAQHTITLVGEEQGFFPGASVLQRRRIYNCPTCRASTEAVAEATYIAIEEVTDA